MTDKTMAYTGDLDDLRHRLDFLRDAISMVEQSRQQDLRSAQAAKSAAERKVEIQEGLKVIASDMEEHLKSCNHKFPWD